MVEVITEVLIDNAVSNYDSGFTSLIEHRTVVLR